MAGNLSVAFTVLTKRCSANQLADHEVTVVGSRCGPMDEAVAMLARGEVAVEPLVSGVFPLAEAPQALVAADRAEAVKVLVRC